MECGSSGETLRSVAQHSHHAYTFLESFYRSVYPEDPSTMIDKDTGIHLMKLMCACFEFLCGDARQEDALSGVYYHCKKVQEVSGEKDWHLILPNGPDGSG